MSQNVVVICDDSSAILTGLITVVNFLVWFCKVCCQICFRVFDTLKPGMLY